MKDTIISRFIDDDLNFEEKIEFIEQVQRDLNFKNDAIALIRQEKLIRSDPVIHTPNVVLRPRRNFWHYLWRPMGMALGTLIVAFVILTLAFPTNVTDASPYRFVIYQPEVDSVEITGSFVRWERLPMSKIGSTGYWELTVLLPKGEHRFAYVIGGKKRLADPTILTREKDDFGGENSILVIDV